MFKFNVYGAEHKQPIIFIHGAFVSAKMWDDQVRYFSNFYKVIIYDLRGHGANNHSATDKFSFDLFSEDLKSIVNDISTEVKPIICGLSLGGMVAQHFAVKYPHDYKALVLCDTSVTMSLTLWDKIMLTLFPKWLMISLLKLYSIRSYVFLSFAIAKITRGIKWLGKQKTIDYEKSEMLQMKKADWIKTYDMLYDFRKQDLRKIQKPVLIVLGEYESKSTYRHAEVMHQEILNAKTEIIEEAGHVPNIDQPEKFNKALHEFLEQVYA